ncbi:hypothetical protein F2Q68_00046210 [Brassica cretica]|uniref:RNase H type-1 domain-containing protein n=1 Tax=Brassica cretica TaxID=69181 RepID=A0A8S9LKY6_BRACR|nr:hypothetical protein F2Q68_00046210 [Brassica cretica]
MKKPSLHQTDICISEAGNPTFYITYIYGNPDQRLRNLHSKKLTRMGEAGIFNNKPRVVLGDLNDIKSNDEKDGGPRRAEYTFNTFRRMLNTLGLHDLRTVGDGSWTSPTDNAGIGWALFNTDGRIILEGKAAIEPVNSPLDAEAKALRMAVVQMRKLGYHIVTFYGDSSESYDTLSNSHQASSNSIKGNHCPTYMKDIANLAKNE